MMLCAQAGHDVVALANLYPPQEDVDELDSYMYQTVGHQVLEQYACCTSLPLIRQQIRRSPKIQVQKKPRARIELAAM